jgi:hypothetical protein
MRTHVRCRVVDAYGGQRRRDEHLDTAAAMFGTPPAAGGAMATSPDTASSVDLMALVERLRAALPTVVPEFGRGRERICEVVARDLGVDAGEADGVVSTLTERGLLQYNDDGRTVGVPGHWALRAPDAA